MGQSDTLYSSLAGVVMGVVFDGSSWRSGAQPGTVAAVGIVWAVAGGTTLYVHRIYEAAQSKWALVIAGAVFVSALAALSMHTISTAAGSSCSSSSSGSLCFVITLAWRPFTSNGAGSTTGALETATPRSHFDVDVTLRFVPVGSR